MFKQNGLNMLTKNLQGDVLLVGPQLVDEKNEYQPSMYMFDSPLNIICEQFRLGKLLPNRVKRIIAPYELKKPCDLKPNWIIGAFYVMRKKDYFKVNGFSEDFFMYSEDMDICYKIKKNNGTICFYSKYKVQHLGGVSEQNDMNFTKTEKMFRSRLHFAKKYKLKANQTVFMKCYEIKKIIFSLLGLFKNMNNNIKKYNNVLKVLKGLKYEVK